LTGGDLSKDGAGEEDDGLELVDERGLLFEAEELGQDC
jgi:hypothetical protein